jgi:hypothetical protein
VSINDDAIHYIYILIHAISFKFQPIMKLNIHNQCPNFKLINLNWSVFRIKVDKELDRKIDARSMMSAVFTSPWAEFDGALTYELQKKSVKSDDQLESTSTRLFIAWKPEGYNVFFCACKLDRA